MKEMIKKLQRKSNKKGFTLVEIIVVLVILAILAAVAVPSVMGYVKDARNSRYVAEARSIYLVTQVEEAKIKAAADDPSTVTISAADYTNIATTAKESTDLEVKKIEYVSGKYQLTWESDKEVKATVEENKEVKIVDSFE